MRKGLPVDDGEGNFLPTLGTELPLFKLWLMGNPAQITWMDADWLRPYILPFGYLQFQQAGSEVVSKFAFRDR
jgi:hypothetical protein